MYKERFKKKKKEEQSVNRKKERKQKKKHNVSSIAKKVFTGIADYWPRKKSER